MAGWRGGGGGSVSLACPHMVAGPLRLSSNQPAHLAIRHNPSVFILCR